MEITVERFLKTNKSTISDLKINGVHQCYILEDVDRGLSDAMTPLEIKTRKVFGKTAIPTGRYRVVISFSPRFKKYLPEILNVKGYAGIRQHPGNIAQDTEGCQLPGISYTTDKVLQSRLAFAQYFSKLQAVEKSEEIWITIT